MDLQLNDIKHPDDSAQTAFDGLIAIDDQKNALLGMLEFLFDKKKLESWHKKHHGSGLKFLKKVTSGTPLIILEGDVGCGKTALAHAVGTPLARILNKRVQSFETPSDIRGTGRVGEISSRITEAFTKAKALLKGDDVGIFIIDEADDLAADREQVQAHHEDKAGLNVLIKQIDAVAKGVDNLAVILITNRMKALDPAVIRRATQIITFNRPDKEGRKKVFEMLLDGTHASDKDLEDLARASERTDYPYSFSDLVERIGRQAIMKSINEDRTFNKTILLEVIKTVTPSPLIK
jgi:SpoVK/Ycf46/Vps4 family AAA+-type ATPase